MDRKTLSIWGWTIVVVLVISIMVVAATPLSQAISRGLINLTDNFGSSNNDSDNSETPDHTHTPGPEATCTTAQTCTTCTATVTEALGHKASEGWATDENAHWHICTNGCGEILDQANHTPNVESATETIDKVCTVCSYVIEAATEKASCTHSSYTTVDYESPTCTESGYVMSQCVLCEQYFYSSLNAKGHNMKQTAAAVAATCTSTGKTAVLTCANGCGTTQGGGVLEKLPHNMQQTKAAVAATCTSGGKTAVYTCSSCGATEGGTSTAALGHDYSEVSASLEWDENDVITNLSNISGKCTRCPATIGGYYENNETGVYDLYLNDGTYFGNVTDSTAESNNTSTGNGSTNTGSFIKPTIDKNFSATLN